MSKRTPKADCPMSMLMHMLSGPWTIYILWTLGKHGPTRFGSLKRQISGVSSKVLTERLRMLEEMGLVFREYEPTIPPQVTYGITERTLALTPVLDELATIAQNWYGEDPCFPPLSELRASEDAPKAPRDQAKDASGNAVSVPS
ncbi:HTH-type transcriptional activator HxlR [compost metagenome]